VRIVRSTAAFFVALNCTNGKTISAGPALMVEALGLGCMIAAVGSAAAILQRHIRGKRGESNEMFKPTAVLPLRFDQPPSRGGGLTWR